MIRIKDVRKVYGKKDSAFEALKGVSFDIPDGASAAIIGKSGSGKSTLMHIMGGLDHPSAGEVVIDGKPIGTLKRKAIDRFRAHDLGFVFQSFFVEGNQTCYQNVALPLEINQVAFSRRRALVEEALEAVELSDKINTKAKNLSGGQKQRLAIARAIVGKPKLIFADEPTGNLDSATGDRIIELLFDLNKRLGATLVFVTHDIDLAARCDIQVVLKDGQIVTVRGRATKRAKGTKR
ncbi:MAG TPA: ABC transporter ATP-binding protein [Candidatus Saccharimonadales bacterium]|nr:ABC transporter ATP-binding protein [Candidatus Saccharimonadales bacterium]